MVKFVKHYKTGAVKIILSYLTGPSKLNAFYGSLQKNLCWKHWCDLTLRLYHPWKFLLKKKKKTRFKESYIFLQWPAEKCILRSTLLETLTSVNAPGIILKSFCSRSFFFFFSFKAFFSEVGNVTIARQDQRRNIINIIYQVTDNTEPIMR